MCYTYSKYYLPCQSQIGKLRMLRVKSDWRNRLIRDLDTLLRIDEERVSSKMFNSEPAKSICFNDKIRLTASTHRISTMKRQKCSDAEFVSITELAI